MNDNKWRFPNNNYTNERGLDTSDMEMFKQNPVSSLAREICQNSIDAPNSDKPVQVDFELFSIPREEIPGIDDLTDQINKCYEYKKDSPKEGPALKALKNSIHMQYIPCMRISDFNTTGLIGAGTNEPGKPFYNLTKGSGISDKDGNSGGSKGIGKYASFVVSTTNTVFYSTQANDNSSAYIGISQLRSAPISNDDPDLLTMGIGYYGQDKKNSPISGELFLDKNFTRGKNEYGTDIFIIGFNNKEGWQGEIIAKVLESFMVAIALGKLEVNVDGIKVNKDSIKNIIYDDQFQKHCSKPDLREIQAQYELLNNNDDSVTVRDLQIDDNNSVTVYVKKYNQQNEKKATNQCVMVRDPYMKIKDIGIGGHLPYSALCIIHNNELNKRLRDIENPKHTDWEIRRLDSFPDEQKITKKMKNSLEQAVRGCIRDVLRIGAGEKTDIEGAGEFLPQEEDGNSTTQTNVTDEVKINPMTKVNSSTKKVKGNDENGEMTDFDKGELSEEGVPGRKLKPKAPGPDQPRDNNHEKIGPGNSPVIKKYTLKDMQFKNIVTNKSMGEYTCIFTSKYDENNCELSIKLCGDSGDKYPIDILSASINGKACNIDEGKITGLKITKNNTYKILYSVNQKGQFASEVILNACRE